jgi:tetrahydromethanopterin S-methyltransferase subunit G
MPTFRWIVFSEDDFNRRRRKLVLIQYRVQKSQAAKPQVIGQRVEDNAFHLARQQL